MNVRLIVALGLIVLRPHPEALGPQLAVYLADLALLAVLGWPVLRRGAVWVPAAVRPAAVIGSLVLCTGWVLAIINLHRGVALPDVSRFTLFAVFAVLLIDLLGGDPAAHGRAVARALDRFFWVVAAVAAAQLLDPPILGDAVRAVWGSTKLRSLWYGYPRIYGTFYNANWFGLYLAFMLALWCGRAVAGHRLGGGTVVRIVILGVLLFLSGSRTGLVGAVLVLAGATPWLVRGFLCATPSGVFVLATAVAVVVLGVGVQYSDVFGKLIDRYEAFQALLAEGQSDRSVTSRMSLWRESFQYFERRPYLGYGAVPGTALPHNSYLTVALSMGLPVLLLVLAFGGLLLAQALGRLLIHDHPGSLTFLLFSGALAFAGISGEYFYASQVVLLWLLALAIAVMPAEHEVARTSWRLTGAGPDEERGCS